MWWGMEQHIDIRSIILLLGDIHGLEEPRLFNTIEIVVCLDIATRQVPLVVNITTSKILFIKLTSGLPYYVR